MVEQINTKDMFLKMLPVFDSWFGCLYSNNIKQCIFKHFIVKSEQPEVSYQILWFEMIVLYLLTGRVVLLLQMTVT